MSPKKLKLGDLIPSSQITYTAVVKEQAPRTLLDAGDKITILIGFPKNTGGLKKMEK